MTTTETRPEINNYGGRHPYAGLLHNISEGADVTQALAEADLLYGVEKVPLIGTHPLDTIPVTDRMLTVRVDDPVTVPTALAVVGADYQVISNVDAFAPLDALREAGRITFDQGGRTRDGRNAFLLCRLTDGHTVPGGDPHDRFILARTSHDGTSALRLMPVARRYWCCNQMPAILATSRNAIVSIHHGRSARERMEQLPGMLDLLVTSLDQFDEEWKILAGSTVNTRDVDRFLTRLFPTPHGPDVTDRMRVNVVERRRAVDALLDGPTNANIRGTKAALIAAATEWAQWGRSKDARRSGLRALEGTDLEFNRRAWELAHA
jgi:phage/plasmid-like protein (TIGR03299 family)